MYLSLGLPYFHHYKVTPEPQMLLRLSLSPSFLLQRNQVRNDSLLSPTVTHSINVFFFFVVIFMAVASITNEI